MAEDRARSFIERYIIARAVHFTVGREQEDAWAAALDGKAIYRNIADVARTTEPDTLTQGQQVGAGVSAGPANVGRAGGNAAWPPLMPMVPPLVATGGANASATPKASRWVSKGWFGKRRI